MCLKIFTEYYSIGSVGKLLENLEKPLGELQIHYILKEVLLGLEFLHDKLKICHRDLKCANLLIGDDLSVRIGNFALTAKAHSVMKKRFYFIKSPHYMAPEVVCERNNQYDNPKSDIWSLGICCIEMAEKFPPLSDVLNPNAVLNEIRRDDFRPGLSEPAKWTLAFHDFVSRCLCRDLDARASVMDLLEVIIYYLNILI
jgi:serine/threonine protein kinase